MFSLFLNYKLFWMNNIYNNIIEFSFRIIWRIMEILKGVIRQGRTLLDLLKYFSVSDWPKSHAQFIITSYCRRIFRYIMWTDGISHAAKLPDYWMVNREGLGTRLSCFWWWVQNGRTFHLFHGEEVGKLFTKNIARTTRRQPCYLENICRTEKLFIS